MKKLAKMVAVSSISVLFSPLAMAATDIPVAFVNVTELFNSSTYVQKANKKLQDNAKAMEVKLQADQKKLQKRVDDYNKAVAAGKKNENTARAILAEQARLTALTQEAQQKIRDEQSTGMEAFTKLVQTASEQVAKEKNIHTILNSTAIVYTDNTWVDVTRDVSKILQNN